MHDDGPPRARVADRPDDRTSWLGDLVLGAPWHPQLLDRRPGPWDRVVVVPPYPQVRGGAEAARDTAEVRAFLAAQRRERYDLAVQLHGGGAGSNPFVAALGARVSAGARDSGALPLDRELPCTSTQHEVLRCLGIVGLVGAEPGGRQPTPAPGPDDAALAAGATCPVCGADEHLGRCGHDASLVAGIGVAEVSDLALDLLAQVGDRDGHADPAAVRAG